jgi:M6 family metalloprotease-like protein
MAMRRKFPVLFIIVFLVSNLYAAYLKNVPQCLVQPDGAVIHCFATGDEFHNWLHDSAGYTIIQDIQTGYYVYAVQSGNDIVASKHIVGAVNPAALGLKPYANISAEAMQSKRAAFEQQYLPLRTQKGVQKNEGTIHNLAFFVRFSDEAGFDTLHYNTIEKMFNDSSSLSSNSLYNFYRISSYGKMFITSHFFPADSNNIILSYQDIYPRSYYQLYDATSNPNGYTAAERNSREFDLLKRVVEFFQDSVTISANDLDFNGDGNIDNVAFIISGKPVGWNDLLWPHRWSLYAYNIKINGKRVYDFNFILGGYCFPGVITHEMMHTLSAPDLYRYEGSTFAPVGEWDLMASTNYNSPQGLGAYMKYQYGGWIDSIPEISLPGTYTLYPTNGTSPEKTCYKIYPKDSYSGEYLVLEYRKTSSNIFESNLPGSGLLIYRINEDHSSRGNAGYDGITYFDEVYLFRPNGTTTVNGNLLTAHFGSDYNRTAFNLVSNPSPFYYDGSLMEEISISNISEVGDSIQFTIEGVAPESLSVSPSEVVLKCTFGTSGQFTINSNVRWSIIGVNSQWLSLDKSSGGGTDVITLRTLSANYATTSRACTLRISTSSYAITDTVIVEQAPCVAITETEDKPTVSLFPNPADDYISIICPEINTFTAIAVYAMTGEQVYPAIIQREDDKAIMDTHGLAAGVYYIKLYSPKHAIVKSFAVQ